ncbi:MAG TPA: glycerol-3-phosphate acyltransferase [Longilinea sp.]|nr:glycerol-3-phosphate acyltransferase [Longilinea sp.]
MTLILSFIVCVLAYLVGSIPFGLVFVRLIKGKDILSIGSGRTGTTNAIRAGGLFPGALTVLFDTFKGTAAVWLAKALVPELFWVHVLCATLAIIGHNYSIFLIQRDESGKIHLRGGAGGATCLGGAIGLWSPALTYLLPAGFLVYIIIGYASVTTISAALMSIILFGYRSVESLGPVEYTLYGVFSLFIVLWALRPNIERLRLGTERAVGLRALRQKLTREKAVE